MGTVTTVTFNNYNLFPTLAGIGFPVRRSPEWKTLRQESVSGKQYPVGLMAYPLWNWELPFDLLRSTAAKVELQTLQGFINQQNGGAIPFAYNDSHDNTVTAQANGVGTAGGQTVFQLVRTWGGFTEPVVAVHGAFTVYLDTVAQETTAYTITDGGVLTFGTAPGAGVAITWTGFYYWLVTFPEDLQEFEEFMYHLWSAKNIRLRSYR